jgi:YbbR domain-containing protein
VRRRDETISKLGRSPARQSQPIPPIPSTGREPPPPNDIRTLVRSWLHGALFDNTGLKFLSMVLAVTVFLLVNTDKDREITVRVGLKYEYPSDVTLVGKPVAEVHATIKGPLRRLRAFDERELNTITLDLHDAPTGDVPIPSDKVTGLPPGLKVTSLNPQSVHVAFERIVDKVVEVVPTVIGHPQHGYVAAEPKAAPATIKVRGGEHVLAALTSIRTTEVSLENQIKQVDELAGLVAPEGVLVDPTQRISVTVPVKQDLVTQTIPTHTVLVRGEGVEPTRWAVTPDKVEVTLTGTLLLVEKAEQEMALVVKLTAKDDKARDQVPIIAEGVPPGVGVKISPERVKVAPVKAPAPPGPTPQ